MAHRQLRVGFSGAYGLDWLVILRMADDVGVTTDAVFYELLSTAEVEMLTAMNPPKPEEGEE